MNKIVLFLLLLFCVPCFSQNKHVKVLLRNGASVEGVVKEFDPLDHITIMVGDLESKIPMSQVAYVSNITNQEDSIKNDVAVEKVMVEVPVPSDYKGFLLEKGNNVYVYYGNSDGDKNAEYDKEGAMVIRTLLKKDGFWNVVDNMNQAHFTINFSVITKGRDTAQLSVSSWRTGKLYFLAIKHSSEDITKNNIIAQHFYHKEIR